MRSIAFFPNSRSWTPHNLSEGLGLHFLQHPQRLSLQSPHRPHELERFG
jgi:hypothetical protein